MPIVYCIHVKDVQSKTYKAKIVKTCKKIFKNVCVERNDFSSCIETSPVRSLIVVHT